MSLSKVIHFA